MARAKTKRAKNTARRGRVAKRAAGAGRRPVQRKRALTARARPAPRGKRGWPTELKRGRFTAWCRERGYGGACIGCAKEAMRSPDRSVRGMATFYMNTVKPGGMTASAIAREAKWPPPQIAKFRGHARQILMRGRPKVAANPFIRPGGKRIWVPPHVSRPRMNPDSRVRRNELSSAMPMAKSLVQADALKDFALVTGGLVAGAVLPTLIVKGLNQAGIMKGAGGTVAKLGLGILASAAAGVAVGVVTKNRRTGVLVAAGGLAGVIGVLIVEQLDKLLGAPAAGQVALLPTGAATGAVTGAAAGQMSDFPTVEEIMRAAEGPSVGMADFVTQGEAEEATGVIGDFVTKGEAEEATAVQAGRTAQLTGLGRSAGSASEMQNVAQMFGLSGTETDSDMSEEMDGFGYDE